MDFTAYVITLGPGPFPDFLHEEHIRLFPLDPPPGSDGKEMADSRDFAARWWPGPADDWD